MFLCLGRSSMQVTYFGCCITLYSFLCLMQDEKSETCFLLHCQKFIELARVTSLLVHRSSKVLWHLTELLGKKAVV